MSRVCDFCWKGTATGRHIRHHVKTSQWKFKAPKKPRKLKANIQKIRLNVGGVMRTFRICTQCMRTMMKNERTTKGKDQKEGNKDS